MARRMLSPAIVAMLGFVTLAQIGCVGTRHRLTPEARDFRNVAPAPEAPRELAKTLHPTHVIEPGDVLLVQPSEIDSPVRLIADQPVHADGTIDLGKYGRPVVAGKTVPEVEAEIQQLVQAKTPWTEGVLNVRLINKGSKVYYVLGEVASPGAFPLTGRETALDAIIAAGGLTCNASEQNIILSRPTGPCEARDVKPVCYRQIVQLGDTTTNYQIMAGDRIYVPSRSLKERLCPDGCGRTRCGPCVTPQLLKPMERPGCGIECLESTAKSESKPTLPCKTEECKRSGLGCEGWGITGCFLTRSKKTATADCDPIVPGQVYDGVIVLEQTPATTKPATPQVPPATLSGPTTPTLPQVPPLPLPPKVDPPKVDVPKVDPSKVVPIPPAVSHLNVPPAPLVIPLETLPTSKLETKVAAKDAVKPVKQEVTVDAK